MTFSETMNTCNGCCQVNFSEQIGLLHNPLEFFVVDFTITITVCLVNHFLKFFISQSLPQFFGHSLEVLERHLASVIIIKKFECFINLLYWVTVESCGPSCPKILGNRPC